MSLARACLRLAAIAALRGVTLAETRVFDSRIGAIDALEPTEAKPVIAVYTEEEAGGPLGESGPPFKPHVELVFELSMVEAAYDEAEKALVIGYPTTDAELEVSLDVLEQQVKVTLFEDMSNPLAVLFRTAYRHGIHYQSMRFREETKGERIARRYVVVKVEVADEPVLGSYDASVTGLARLPPTFRRIAEAWPDGLNEKAVALAIAEAFPQPSINRGIDFIAAVQPGGDPRNRLYAAFLRPKPPCPTP